MRRLVALLGILSVLLGLAACGDEKKAAPSTHSTSSTPTVDAKGLDAVTVSGEFGKEPEVTWNGPVDVEELDSKTLIEGTGDQVAQGDLAVVHLWLGNGSSQKLAYSSYPEDTPQAVKVDDVQLVKAIYAAIADHTVGSRVEVVAPPADTFGDQGNPSLGIDPKDSLVFLMDIMGKALTGPDGTAQTPPAGAPTLTLKDDVPTGFDFSNSPNAPSDKLQVITLIKGTGAEVAKGDTTIMDYLGSVYGSKEVFDESYSKDPFTTPIGKGSVIKGWDQGLVGVPVGSRVLLVIPSDLAYRDEKKEMIPANSTLTFVVDVLATY